MFMSKTTRKIFIFSMNFSRPNLANGGESIVSGKRLHPKAEDRSISTPNTGVPWTNLLEGHGKLHYIITSNGEARRVSPGVKLRVHFTPNHHVKGNSANAKERLLKTVCIWSSRTRTKLETTL
ncbi:Uncharacterized protein TCM_003770 [Theobroma cacao]|uniref:Uncharacterized protein n=1 Tax=Theobroma cacao TaxID=3641 RepID=A0A061DW74_THECC|nr:Uncharacterized protein TCM_003770 [Theobroma cacao]